MNKLASILDSKYLQVEKIEEKIMTVIYDFVEENKIIDFNRVMNVCTHTLHIDGIVVLNVLESLQKQKRIFFGQKLIRDFLLKNPTRKMVYNYLKEHPGIRLNEIAERINIPIQLLEWNMAILLKYECIQNISINQTNVFGIFEEEPESIIFGFFSRNERSFYILQKIYSQSCQINDLLENPLKLSYHSIYYQINMLLKYNLIQIYLIETEKFYRITDSFRRFF